jgi:ProP effector
MAHKRVSREERVRRGLSLSFPDCFCGKGQPKKPLAIGIYKEIRNQLPEIKARELFQALSDYTGGPLYLKSLVAGAKRFNLDGGPAGFVSEAQAATAIEHLKIHNKKNRKASQRPAREQNEQVLA